jgi:hypothetical protein
MTRQRKKSKGFQWRTWTIGFAIASTTGVYFNFATHHAGLAAEGETVLSPLPQLGDYTTPEAKAARAQALEYVASIQQRSVSLPPAATKNNVASTRAKDVAAISQGRAVEPAEVKRTPMRLYADIMKVHDPPPRAEQLTSSFAPGFVREPLRNLTEARPAEPNAETSSGHLIMSSEKYPPPEAARTESTAPVFDVGKDDGRGPFGMMWRAVSDLSKDDWVVYLRIQKTGSQTFWQTLQQVFDVKIWGRRQTVRGFAAYNVWTSFSTLPNLSCCCCEVPKRSILWTQVSFNGSRSNQ